MLYFMVIDNYKMNKYRYHNYGFVNQFGHVDWGHAIAS